MSPSIKTLCVIALAALSLTACSKRPVSPVEVDAPREQSWPAEVVDAFGEIPVQDDGRVKPMSTYTGFKLLAMNGKRSYRIPKGIGLPTEGEKLDPVGWALDVVFRHEQAQHYDTFLVNDNAVLTAIGLEFDDRKRRDRYSYAQLAPGRVALDAKVREIIQAEEARKQQPNARKRNRIETGLLNLSRRLRSYDDLRMLGQLATVPIGSEEEIGDMAQMFPDRNGRTGLAPMSRVLTVYPQALAVLAKEIQAGEAEMEQIDRVQGAFEGLARDTLQRAGFMNLPSILPPPPSSDTETWRDPAEVAAAVFSQPMNSSELQESSGPIMKALGTAYASRLDMGAAGAAIVNLRDATVAAAEARGEYSKVPLERFYYRTDFVFLGLVTFIAAFLALITTWVRPRARLPKVFTWTLASAGVLMVVAGLTVRCILMNRPPVATLYETILFITAGAVIAALVAEKWTKIGVALSGAVILGLGGTFFAGKFEVHVAQTSGDTMGGLVAVLNSNFWLATHVVTITLGYAAGLFAAFLGHVWIVARVIAGLSSPGRVLAPETRSFLRIAGGLVYGTVCFGLLLSTVGTILGGVWANDSWGRFWGWDPKENGALLIVLYQLVIVHARLGGYIKNFGVSLLSVIGGAVVAFSWWHVNELGVGLHSYGFTEGVLGRLTAYYLFVVGFSAVALLCWLFLLNPGGPPAGGNVEGGVDDAPQAG